MAENKKGFILYADQREGIDFLTDEEAGQLFKHIYSYVNDENPELTDRVLIMAFQPIKMQLKRDLKKFESVKEKRSEAGKRSAEARREQQTSTNSTSVDFVEQVPTNPTVKENVNVNVNVNVNEKDIKGEKGPEAPPPSLSKISSFKNSGFYDLKKFKEAFEGSDYEAADLEYYHECVKNWADSKGTRRADWIATARGFMLRDKKEGKLQTPTSRAKSQESGWEFLKTGQTSKSLQS